MVNYTPKHGSWLDLAESELGVLAAQCLDRRIADKQTLIDFAHPRPKGHRHLGAIHALVGIRSTFAVPHLAQSSEHPNTSFRRPHA